MDYLNNLNEKQKEAAVHVNGPLLILAGAGSGKTSTMTRRIAYLIREQGVSPYHILAVTFTNKAAREMRERVEALIGAGSPMWILTFHSACLRILRQYGERLGYSRDFTIYDTTDQKTVIKNCVKAANLDEKKYSPQYMMSIISKCKEKGITGANYNKHFGNDFKEKPIGDLYRAYESVLKKNNAMDFDDLLCNAVRLLETDEEVRHYYQNRFHYIMVDEYQDTNYMQYRLVKLLSEPHNNICVVGDDDQCIYQWRGADIKNILDFERDYKDTKVIKLEQNYRSYGNILKAAHSVISHNKGRKPKELWTDKEGGELLTYYRASDEKEEARYVARQIDRLKTRERRYSDFAVLYRTNAQSRTFEEAFMAAEIPYRVLGGTKFYDRKEIKDMMCYLRLVLNPADELSFSRIINEPKRGIGAVTLGKIQALASVSEKSPLVLLQDEDILDSLPKKSVDPVKEMVHAVMELHHERDNLKVSDIYDALLVRTGYLKELEKANTIEAEGRIENLLELKSVMYSQEEDNPMLTLSEFLENVALVSDIDNHSEEENAVVLMTMHSAKGLEFPIVFLPGLEDGLFPGWRAMDTPDGIEEERRLCYVGITRAEEKLFLISAEQRTLYGRTEYTRESVFLEEIDRTLLDPESSKVGESKMARAMNSGDSGAMSRTGAGNGSRPSSQSRGGIRPFDQLKYIKQNKAATGAAQGGKGRGSESFRDGDRIRHNKFGEGLVISVQNGTATIAFDSVGIKKLALDIAPLTKVD